MEDSRPQWAWRTTRIQLTRATQLTRAPKIDAGYSIDTGYSTDAVLEMTGQHPKTLVPVPVPVMTG